MILLTRAFLCPIITSSLFLANILAVSHQNTLLSFVCFDRTLRRTYNFLCSQRSLAFPHFYLKLFSCDLKKIRENKSYSNNICLVCLMFEYYVEWGFAFFKIFSLFIIENLNYNLFVSLLFF